jgi:hypothetical protein
VHTRTLVRSFSARVTPVLSISIIGLVFSPLFLFFFSSSYPSRASFIWRTDAVSVFTTSVIPSTLCRVISETETLSVCEEEEAEDMIARSDCG